jgi:hypothetical protein
MEATEVYVEPVDLSPSDATDEAPLTDEHLEIVDGYEDASVAVQGSCQVWLTVVGTRTEPDAITERLGLVSTSTLRKGSPVPYLPAAVPGPVVKANRWEIRVPVATDQDLDEHLKVLEGIMSEDVTAALRELSDEGYVRIEIEISHDSGIVLPATLVRRLAEAGGSFDIDVRY